MSFDFTVPGPPVPKGRPRRGRGGHFYTPKATRDYEKTVAWAARAAGIRGPSTGSVSVTVHLWFPDRRRRDVDNVVKSILDGLNRIAYADDAQVAELHVTRGIDGRQPRAEIEIEVLP